MLRILYEDNHLIAVYKPAGLLVQGDKTGDKCLMDEVKQYIKNKYHKPGNVFLGLLHRLDQPVSGIVLFAKTSKAAGRLSEQIRERKVKKIYQALVQGILPAESGTLVHYLKKDTEKNKVRVVAPTSPNPSSGRRGSQALRAELDYEVLKSNGRNSWVKIDLKTGRPHQIRAQLAAIGCPILGDIKYGAKKPLPDQTIALSATSFTFQTATGGETKTVAVEPPASWRI